MFQNWRETIGITYQLAQSSVDEYIQRHTNDCEYGVENASGGSNNLQYIALFL